jgi:hypothetical protein
MRGLDVVKTALIGIAAAGAVSITVAPAHAADHGPWYYKPQTALVSGSGVESATYEMSDGSSGVQVDTRVSVWFDRQRAVVIPPKPYDLRYPIRVGSAETMVNFEVETVERRWGQFCAEVVERTFGQGMVRASLQIEPPGMRHTRKLPSTRKVTMGADRRITLYVQPVERLPVTVTVSSGAADGRGQCMSSAVQQPPAGGTPLGQFSGAFTWTGRIKPKATSTALIYAGTSGRAFDGKGWLSLKRPLTSRW